jgi:hypothetical protein
MHAAFLSLLLAQAAIDATDARLADVFADLAKQTGERFEVDSVIRDAKVTVAFKDVRALEAAVLVCRAHGAARLVAPMQGGPFLISPAPAADGPGAASGPFWLRLTGARSTKTTDFRGGKSELFALDLQLLWERKTTPACVRLRVVEATDDTGAALARDAVPDAVRTMGKPAQILAVVAQLKHPVAGAKKISKLAVEAETWTTAATVAIAVGDLAVGTGADFEGGRATIARSSRAAAAWTGVLEVKMPKSDDGAPLAPADRLRAISLTGDDGKSYAASIVTSLARDGKLSVELVATDVPREAKLTGLKASWIVRFERAAHRFAFTDVEVP